MKASVSLYLSREDVPCWISRPVGQTGEGVFTTSKVMDFFDPDELVKQTGQPKERLPLVVMKEPVDNALDPCERQA